jgi:hypothetical protein
MILYSFLWHKLLLCHQKYTVRFSFSGAFLSLRHAIRLNYTFQHSYSSFLRNYGMSVMFIILCYTA